MVVTCGSRGILRVWDTTEKECIMEEGPKSLETPLMQLFALQSPEQERIVALSRQLDFLFYNTSPLVFDRLLVGANDEIIDIKWIQDGRTLLVASNCDQVRMFDVETMACRVMGGHRDIILAVDANADGSLLCSASKDNTIRVWDSATLACVGECVGHTESVGAVAMSKRSSDFLVSGSQDKTLKVWNLLPAQENLGKSSPSPQACPTLRTIKAHDAEINTVAIAPNDALIATGSRDKLVKLWTRDNLQLRGVLRGHRRGIWSVQFSPVDRCVASSSADKTIKIWSLSDYSCLRTLEGHTGSVLKVAFLTRGMQLLSTGSDGLVKLWTIKTNECVRTLEHHDDKVWALATQADGARLVTGDGDSKLTIWEDVTQVEKEEAQQDREQQLLREQQLSNLLHAGQWQEAVHLALQLQQPYRVRTILMDVQSQDPVLFVTILHSLRGTDTLETCLEYVRDWNTSARFAPLAQAVLYELLKVCPPQDLLQMKSVKSLLQALLPYTDRHFQRVDQLLQKACIIDFTLQRMQILTPLEEVQEPEQEAHLSMPQGEEEEGDVMEEDVDVPGKEHVSAPSQDDEEPAHGEEEENSPPATPPPSKKRKRTSSTSSTPLTPRTPHNQTKKNGPPKKKRMSGRPSPRLGKKGRA